MGAVTDRRITSRSNLKGAPEMNTGHVTYCPPAEAAGHRLDDVIAFLRAGCELSTARLLATVTDCREFSCKTWKKLNEYKEKIACDGAYNFQMEIYENLFSEDEDSIIR
jgi:hypothetical protein